MTLTRIFFHGSRGDESQIGVTFREMGGEEVKKAMTGNHFKEVL